MIKKKILLQFLSFLQHHCRTAVLWWTNASFVQPVVAIYLYLASTCDGSMRARFDFAPFAYPFILRGTQIHSPNWFLSTWRLVFDSIKKALMEQLCRALRYCRTNAWSLNLWLGQIPIYYRGDLQSVSPTACFRYALLTYEVKYLEFRKDPTLYSSCWIDHNRRDDQKFLS